MTVVDGPAVERVVAFSRLLRERGVASTPLSSIEASRVLAAIDAADRTDVHLAFRSIFVSRAADLALFDALFDEWWGEMRAASGTSSERRRKRDANPPVVTPWEEPQRTPATALTRWAESLSEADSDETVPIAAPSPRDATGSTDFRSYSSSDLDALEAAAARIVRRLRARPSRRWRVDRRGRRLDPRHPGAVPRETAGRKRFSATALPVSNYPGTGPGVRR